MPNLSSFSGNREALNAYYKKYRQKNTLKLRKYNREYNKFWRKKFGYHNEENSANRYPEKLLAGKKLRYAVKCGKIKRLSCAVCGSLKTQAHHPDYSKCLKVVWLCPIHHTQLHKKLKPLQDKSKYDKLKI